VDAPGLAEAARHKAAVVCSASAGPNRSRNNLRNWPARMVSIVSPSAIGTPSLSETSCNARVASELGTKLSGFPKRNDRQNALANGIGDEV